MKKRPLIPVEETKERLAEIELDLQRLKDKWKSFERLTMVAREKEVPSQIDHDEAVSDFWHWINLSNNKRVMMGTISGKTDNREKHRMRY